MSLGLEGVTGAPKLGPPQHEGQICSQCLMDTSDPEIAFDEQGICNHCHGYYRRIRDDLPGGDRSAFLQSLADRIRKSGTGRPYDCVIGISGGVDSTYVAWLCKRELGLRPLAVHLDNGWNTELAVQNVETVLRALDIHLYTHVIDWAEFRDLQVAFLKSGIANWELPTDHAIRSLLYREAARRGLKYIITGSNLVTEAVMPSAWMADNVDLRLLNAIHRKFGTRKLKSFPRLSLTRLAWYTFVRGIRQIPILNYVDYHKARAMELLERELGWRPYEFKHGESLFTRFFQRHYLPRKFGYDKRRPHLSNLILSGQLTREDGQADLNKPLYHPGELDRDLAYVAKKLELTPAELARNLEAPPRHADDYPNSNWVRRRLPALVSIARRVATGRDFRSAHAQQGINLHVYPSVIGVESRLFRVTKAVQQWSIFERVIILGIHDADDADLPTRQRMGDGREIIRIGTPFPNLRWLPARFVRFVAWYIAAILRFSREPLTCVNCHSLSTLPLGLALKVLTGAKLVYDAHELETETVTSKGIKRLLAKATEALFIGSADAMIVVGPKIGEWYRRRYSGLDPFVVRNLPETDYQPQRLNLFRERLPIPPGDLLFFYQGVLDTGRGVETTLAAFAKAPSDRHVVFLGFGPKSEIIQEFSKQHANIHFLPAVPPNELREYTRSGDIGLCLIEPACLSYVYCMPNKLFEYLGSGVPAIVTDLPELTEVISSGQCGWTVPNDAQELARVVSAITRQDAAERGLRGVEWTADNSWAKECEILQSVYDRLGFARPRTASSDPRRPGLVAATVVNAK